MLDDCQRVDEMSGVGLDAMPEEVLRSYRPMVFRGAVKDSPFVAAAGRSDEAAVEYLDRFYNGRPVNTVVAAPAEKGRFFYRPDSKQLNFQNSPQQLSNVLKGILQQATLEEPIAIAMQAVSAPDCLPGLEEENPAPLVPEGTRARVWIGNAVTVAPISTSPTISPA